MDEVRIVKAGVERIPDLEPLWRALHAEHLVIDPRLPGIPMRSQDEAWARRRDLYQGWLSEKDALLLLAEVRGLAVGYAVSHVHEADDSWDTHGRFGVLESLAVLPDMRRRGVGRMLMSALQAELRRLGVTALEIGVVATNEAARRFYERQGFNPWQVHYLGAIPERRD
jgi:ribosomal protein S18 acetylase RimI-like enzyme